MLHLILCREQRQSRLVTVVGIFTSPQAAAGALAADIKDVTGVDVEICFNDGKPDGWSYDSGGDLTWTVNDVHPDKVVNLAHFAG